MSDLRYGGSTRAVETSAVSYVDDEGSRMKQNFFEPEVSPRPLLAIVSNINKTDRNVWQLHK
jgi:hypothetical protein